MGLKLYVWEDVLVDYTSGAMWALADSVEEARSEIRKSYASVPDGDLQKEPMTYEQPVGFAVWGGG